MTLLDAQDTVKGWLGMQPRSVWDRMRDLDVRGYLPSSGEVRRYLPALPNLPTGKDIKGYLPSTKQVKGYLPQPGYDTPSMLVGLAIGVGVGVGLGLVLSSYNVRPSLTLARRNARRALERVEEQLPTRLNITRVEETPKH